jgi:putative redox protein
MWGPADVCAIEGAQTQVVSHMTATARPVAGSLRHEVDVNGRHTIRTDEPERLGGTDAAPAPHELLAAMVASCVSTMIAMYASARGWALEGLSVDVAYDPEPTPRHAEVIVHLPPGLREDQVRRLRRVAETCPARRALEAGFTFDEQLVFDAGAKACPTGS